MVLLLSPHPKGGEGLGEGNKIMLFCIISFLYNLKREKNKEKKVFISPLTQPSPRLGRGLIVTVLYVSVLADAYT